MNEQRDKNKKWIKVAGWAAFLFFLLKGIAWLGVFYFVGKNVMD